MARTRPLRWVGAGAAVLAAALLAGSGSDEALVRMSLGVGSGAIPVGVAFAVGVPLEAVGGRVVRVLSAAVVGVPDGVRVDGVYAVSYSETGPRGITLGAADVPWLRARHPELHMHPVTDAVVSGRLSDWYLVVEVAATRPGRFSTTGVRVAYEVDGSYGEQVMPMEVALDATTAAPAASG